MVKIIEKIFERVHCIEFRLIADSSLGIISSIVLVVLVFGYLTKLHAKVKNLQLNPRMKWGDSFGYVTQKLIPCRLRIIVN